MWLHGSGIISTLYDTVAFIRPGFWLQFFYKSENQGRVCPLSLQKRSSDANLKIIFLKFWSRCFLCREPKKSDKIGTVTKW